MIALLSNAYYRPKTIPVYWPLHRPKPLLLKYINLFRLWYYSYNFFVSSNISLHILNTHLWPQTSHLIYIYFLQLTNIFRLPLIFLKLGPTFNTQPYKLLFYGLYTNNFDVIATACLTILQTNTPRNIRRNWLKLIKFLTLYWYNRPQTAILSGLSLYISGNISQRAGKRKKFIHFTIGQPDFKNISTYIKLYAFPVILPTTLVNIGIKLSE